MNSIFPKPKHAHKSCVARLNSRVAKIANESGKKFGANQLLVLNALIEDHKAISAYEIVERIVRTNGRLQPVQVYRALDGLLKLGLVHRLRSKNAYVACNNFDICEAPQLFYCSSCEQVAEISGGALPQHIARIAQENSFKLDHGLVELIGQCSECSGA
ncbi:MAG: transcriptional repressor [Hyphomicrobiales bacterium]|nr:transcriptional repressor [Hyphomicrobiales bacterium]